MTWHDGDITAGGKARQEDILKEVADSDILQERKVAMNWKNKTVFIGDNLNVMRGVSYGT